MALCPTLLIDGNATTLWVAKEDCPRELPATPDWYAQEPNSYSGFGGNTTAMSRKFIDPSRQVQKGTAVDEDAAGGWNQDLTKSNLTRLLQGFFFADARQPASSQPLNGTQIPITSVSTVSGVGYYNAASGLGIFKTGDLVFASGFSVPAINEKVFAAGAAGSATAVTTEAAGALGNEASPPSTARIDVVGVEFATADAAMSYVSGVASLTTTVYDFTTNTNLFAGQWVFLGGDAVGNRFANNVGYARIKTVAAKSLTFDECTWQPVTEAGTGKDIRMFIPITVKNENDSTLIKKKTYNVERTLGLSSEGLVQAEYLEGAIPNELTVTIPTGDKVMADLGFVATRTTERLGLTSPVSDVRKTGTRVASPKQRALNTSTDVYRLRMSLYSEANPYLTPLFAYVTEATFKINNNANPHKAVGILGALDTTPGTFEVTGTATAYFVSPVAKRAMRALSDVSINFIIARDNAGTILDIPLVTITGGEISVEKDTPVTIPLEASGAENALGYTASYSEFMYLPDIAMPTASA